MPSTRSRLVASAATVIATIGSIAQPPVKWSDTETELNPRSSIRRISSRQAAGGRFNPGIEMVKRNGCGTRTDSLVGAVIAESGSRHGLRRLGSFCVVAGGPTVTP